MDTHHVGMKLTIHPTKQVDVELHHMPAGVSPQPGASGPGGAPAVGGGEGMVSDPMADGMKGAMDAALAGPHAPIQKPDATRGGNENPAKKAKPADKSVGKKPAANKSPPSKTKPGKGKAPKNTSAEKKVATGSKK